MKQGIKCSYLLLYKRGVMEWDLMCCDGMSGDVILFAVVHVPLCVLQ